VTRALFYALTALALVMHPPLAGAQDASGPVTILRGDSPEDAYTRLLAALTRKRVNLLPLSVVGDRHGKTVVDVWVKPTGKIMKIEISQGSGYPDIDERVVAIVKALGRVPRLPARFSNRDSMILRLFLKFPDALR
jgi:TonB family protein